MVKPDSVVIHYDEIGLKGDNRPYFEKKLQENIKSALKELKHMDLKRVYGRLILNLDKSDHDKIRNKLEKIFGISSFSFSWTSRLDIEDIKKIVLQTLKNEKFSTFAVRARRSDKGFKHTSNEINCMVGDVVVKTGKKVKLKDPELTIHIEVLEKNAYIYLDKHPGLGGLPVGVSGRGLCLLSGGIDSPVAAYMMLSRGLSLDYIHFHSYPITKKQSINKVKKLFKILSEYQPDSRLHLVPLADIQKRIVSDSLESYRILIYRRFMFRLAERLSQKTGAKTLITGESLAQVASQTVENMTATQDATSMIIMRPLVGMSKNDIIRIAERINTYTTSIEPHEDCCSLFVPRHPETRADLTKVREAEQLVDAEKLVEEALNDMEAAE